MSKEVPQIVYIRTIDTESRVQYPLSHVIFNKAMIQKMRLSTETEALAGLHFGIHDPLKFIEKQDAINYTLNMLNLHGSFTKTSAHGSSPEMLFSELTLTTPTGKVTRLANIESL